MKVAVEGCCHGELDKIYETLEFMQTSTGTKVDLLLICGDFQAVRNQGDLQAMAVPQKYQKMNTFYKYYSGEKTAPVLTVFIGGNHEASNYLQELPYGGWVAPNIYYMGYAGVIQFGGIRIAGLSGIYKKHDYHKGHHERWPYNSSTVRSVYHVRNIEVFRLKQISRPIDIVLSHDWPRGIYDHGDTAALLRRKRFLAREVEQGVLGSPGAEELLNHLQPHYWFSAHMHVKFAAIVKHQMTGDKQMSTKFLALDKCLPHREFLQVIEVGSPSVQSPQLEVDLEWLSILRSTNHLFSLAPHPCYLPGPGGNQRYDFRVTDEEIASLSADLGGVLKIPRNFERVAPVHEPGTRQAAPPAYSNPQTTLLCQMLELTDPGVASANWVAPPPGERDTHCDSDDDDACETTLESSVNTTLEVTGNPDAIPLDLTDDDDDDGQDAAAMPQHPAGSLERCDGSDGQDAAAMPQRPAGLLERCDVSDGQDAAAMPQRPAGSLERCDGSDGQDDAAATTPRGSTYQCNGSDGQTAITIATAVTPQGPAGLPDRRDGSDGQTAATLTPPGPTDEETTSAAAPYTGRIAEWDERLSSPEATTADHAPEDSTNDPPACTTGGTNKRPSPRLEVTECALTPSAFTPGGTKKFKRRNQSIYNSPDDL